MIKCENGSGVKNGLEFRLPISAAFLPPVLVAPTDRTANYCETTVFKTRLGKYISNTCLYIYYYIIVHYSYIVAI